VIELSKEYSDIGLRIFEGNAPSALVACQEASAIDEIKHCAQMLRAVRSQGLLVVALQFFLKRIEENKAFGHDLKLAGAMLHVKESFLLDSVELLPLDYLLTLGFKFIKRNILNVVEIYFLGCSDNQCLVVEQISAF
jgi:hypothetical protein